MKCRECGAEMIARVGDYLYDEGGLNLTLQGVTLYHCDTHGDAVSIPRMAELHRTIAQAIIRKPARLAPAEIVFLRKSLGWSGADFAKVFGTSRETISRWENGKVPVGAQADRLLRTLAMRLDPIEDYSLPQEIELLEHIQDDLESSLVGKVARPEGGWRIAA